MAKTKGKQAVNAIKLEQLEIEYVSIDAIRPNEYNPNRQSEHEFNLLLRSIREDGMTQPIIVLRDSGIIVDGEHRWRACKELGYTRIPVVRVNMTEEQRRVATLRHNLARGSHDYALEGAVLRDLEQLGALEWAQEALQLSDVELQRMLEDATPVEVYGTAHETFNQRWDYSPVGEHYDGGTESASSSARIIASRSSAERSQIAQHEAMKTVDADLVKRNLTFTRQEASVINAALGDKPADTMLAISQAHVDAKARAGRGEWTTLSFLVPTSSVERIEAEIARLQPSDDGLTPELRRGLALEQMAIRSAREV